VFATARLKAVFFSVAGPTVWNSLPGDLSNPAVDSEHFKKDLKTHLFTCHYRVLEVFMLSCSTNQHLFTLLLTHFIFIQSITTHEMKVEIKFGFCDT